MNRKSTKPCDAVDLTERATFGDTRILNELVSCFQATLLNFARRYCGNEDDAEEALQDAFEAATRHLEGFRGHASIKTWLTRLVMSACSRKRRGFKNDLSRHVALDQLGESPSGQIADLPEAENKAHLSQIVMRLREALATLNETDQAVLLLRDGEQLSTEETAEHLSITVPAVKSRLHRARKAIRAAMSPVDRLAV